MPLEGIRKVIPMKLYSRRTWGESSSSLYLQLHLNTLLSNQVGHLTVPQPPTICNVLPQASDFARRALPPSFLIQFPPTHKDLMQPSSCIKSMRTFQVWNVERQDQRQDTAGRLEGIWDRQSVQVSRKGGLTVCGEKLTSLGVKDSLVLWLWADPSPLCSSIVLALAGVLASHHYGPFEFWDYTCGFVKRLVCCISSRICTRAFTMFLM